ncbi:MAG: GTP-binding protein [Paracoccaceae bacterium]
MSKLPLTVIGGYLGAGKTTLINHLLTSDHGRKLMIMVNDFGAVNIDAALLSRASDKVLELTNGCVCCTMGADLFLAVGDVLDRPNRPDHLIIEASGIADPAKIATVAKTEPDLSYGGIVTVVDGLNYPDLIQNPQIAPQLQAQVRVADLVLVTKADLTLDAPRVLRDALSIGPLIWALDGDAPDPIGSHADFVKWSTLPTQTMTRDALLAKIEQRPPGLYRLKGFVPGVDAAWHVQVVGRTVDVVRISVETQGMTSYALVGIGVKGQVSQTQISTWWNESTLS